MPETTNNFKRVSPLDGIAIAGHYGLAKNKGVRLAICPPRSIMSVTARNGKAAALSKLMKKHYGLSAPKSGCSTSHKDLAMHWAGPDQWYVTGSDDLDKLSPTASLVDQSHGRITILVSGQNARNVLAKGTPVDLHPSVFKPGHCALTEMAHTSVHIAQIADDEFEVSLYRGFAESFWEWLCEMSLEFGYQVK